MTCMPAAELCELLATASLEGDADVAYRVLSAACASSLGMAAILGAVVTRGNQATERNSHREEVCSTAANAIHLVTGTAAKVAHVLGNPALNPRVAALLGVSRAGGLRQRQAWRRLAAGFASQPAGLTLDDSLRQRIFGTNILTPREDSSLSYVRGRTDRPLLNVTLGTLLERAAYDYSGSEALVSCHQGVRLTYAELLRQADATARGLMALGVQRRDRVGIWAPNCAEWTVLQYAAARVGAILVNLNPSLKAAELAYSLNKAGVSALVLAPELRGTSFVDLLEGVRPQTPQLRHRIVLGPEAPDRALGMLGWYDLLWAGEGSRLGPELMRRHMDLRPGEPANIQFTSGTTGFPKAATLSHRGLVNNARSVGSACHYSEHDRVCIPVPLFHCFGSVMGNLACAVHGATAVYPSDCFDAAATLGAVESERCTSLYGVPTMFIKKLEHPDFQRYNLSTLRTGIMAGAPCPAPLMQRVQKDMHMRDVTICYGMTETSPVSFQTSTGDPPERRVSTVGRVQPHLEARVADPHTGRTLPRGQVGELCVRGYSVQLGYWGDPAATAAAIDEDRWMRTGDLAVLDGAGYCSVVGRIKDMVIRGGENVYPREVEEFLHRHPAVAEVQVFGVPDPKWGEELCAWVLLREGQRQVGGEELRAWCTGRIAGFKIPRYWKMVDSFPTTTSGKPQKFKMREAAIAELGLQAAVL